MLGLNKMKFSLIGLAIVHISCSLLYSQKNDYIWLMGYSPPWDSCSSDGFGGTRIDFNLSPPKIYCDPRTLGLDVFNAIANDEEGNLLFYSNGCYIANSDHTEMMNGDSINYDPNYDDWVNQFNQFCNSFQYSYNYLWGDGSIIPKSKDQSSFYFIHKMVRSEKLPPPLNIKNYRFLMYTIVHYDKIVNKGNVISKNIILANDSLTNTDVLPIKASNNQDWWLISLIRNTNRVVRYLFTKDSIIGPTYQSIGDTIYSLESSGVQCCWAPDGSKYIRVGHIPGGARIYDFDRSTGLLSNYRFLPIPKKDSIEAHGCAISPNGKYLYVAANAVVYQYELDAPDIESTQTVVGEWQPMPCPNASTNFFLMSMGPDCRIYINSNNTVQCLSVIHNPDLKGPACGFEQNAIHLPTRLFTGLPVFPNFRLGTGAVCDPSIGLPSMTMEEPMDQDKNLIIHPNPNVGEFTIRIPNKVVKGILEIFDLSGKRILVDFIQPGIDEMKVELPIEMKGVYLIKITSDEGRTYFEKVIVN